MKYIWVGTWVPADQFKSKPKAPAIIGDYKTYDCPITGKPVEGRLAHRENLERHGCRLYERGETQERIQSHQRESDAHIDRLAEKCGQTMREIV
ncbi:MAG: hypothetical protein ACR2QF_04200 [Geminicoccaceae bacterium]